MTYRSKVKGNQIDESFEGGVTIMEQLVYHKLDTDSQTGGGKDVWKKYGVQEGFGYWVRGGGGGGICFFLYLPLFHLSLFFLSFFVQYVVLHV